MMNFGLVDMRLVSPRDGWPKKGARQAASGAVAILDQARLFDSTEDAVRDLGRIYATTARERGQAKPVINAEEAADATRALWAEGGTRTGILFGPERMGLSNDDVALADAILSFPVNPAFSSLNLAQAVLLVGYEWWKRESGGAAPIAPTRNPTPPPREHVLAFFDFVERELDAVEFFYPPEKAPIMRRNLRNIWHRLALSGQDVQTLRGAFTALVTGRRGGRAPRNPAD
jgi:tRNA/rRNA methyltransferase